MLQYSYLLINLLVISGPLYVGFDKKLRFNSSWKSFSLAILLVAIPFIIWDMAFTTAEIWHFNHSLTLPVRFFGLPPGEILFFLTVPYACLLLFAICRLYNWTYEIHPQGTWAAILGFLILAVTHHQQAYTFTVALLAALLLLISRNCRFYPYLVPTYMLHLPGFLLVNGILTGIPIVTYNDLENSGVRLFSIPVEDFIYSLTLLLANMWLFDRFSRNRRNDA